MWHDMAVYGYMTITCNAAISACGKGREWSRALDVLNIRGEKDDKGEKGEKSNNDELSNYKALNKVTSAVADTCIYGSM